MNIYITKGFLVKGFGIIKELEPRINLINRLQFTIDNQELRTGYLLKIGWHAWRGDRKNNT